MIIEQLVLLAKPLVHTSYGSFSGGKRGQSHANSVRISVTSRYNNIYVIIE